jgi:hypothetical protein
VRRPQQKPLKIFFFAIVVLSALLTFKYNLDDNLVFETFTRIKFNLEV